MCGIIGILGNEAAVPRLVEALQRLEYRGYDSAGVATMDAGQLERRRAKGKLKMLESELESSPLEGLSGIGHTRWATHGEPTVENAHPHMADDVVVVHNGIIENFRELRRELTDLGHRFTSETDTEVIVHLLSQNRADGMSPGEAVKAALKRLSGAFALAIMFKGEEKLMFGARRGSPLVVGYGDGEMYLGSDAIALASLTNRISYLEEGDWVELSHDRAMVFDEDDKPVKRNISIINASSAILGKGNYRHFMLKEIYDQPTVMAQTFGSFLNPFFGRVELPEMPFDFTGIPKITLIACGTSFYAASVARYWFEQIARIPVEVDIASEFRYRDPIFMEGGLAIFISQSGETADTLAALRHAKAGGQHIATIVNVAESSMARLSDVVLQTHAGQEIGVASTKAFTCQLAVLASLAIAAGAQRGHLSAAEQDELVSALIEVPKRMADVLAHDEAIEELAKDVAQARDVLYLGRGADFPIAMEGALKLKEISYIHAEGYAAGEMKHGPIALIDEHVPIIVLAPSGNLFEKTVSNMQEVIARSGKVILISDAEGINSHGEGTVATIEMPSVHPIMAPMLYAIPVQLLAYHVAVHKGTDVDQPRNLAKSVTVE